MPLMLSWQEIALRLALSVVAGALIGLDREEHGRPAGLRTTLLVCLAAAVAMLQANLLLATAGKSSDSFAVLDLMRLPLGILTGMGFIGGGAILRHEGLVIGVTTAATLWFATVVGLCFGGGQIGLGIAAVVIGVLVLSGLRRVEQRIHVDQRGVLAVTTDSTIDVEEEVRAIIGRSGYEVATSTAAFLSAARTKEFEFRVRWKAKSRQPETPPFLRELAGDSRIVAARWRLV